MAFASPVRSAAIMNDLKRLAASFNIRGNKMGDFMTDPKQSFEQILTNLETVVRELEQGGLPLEQALERFESGIKLAREGARRLDEAQRRVEEILEGGDLVPVGETKPD